MQQNHLDYVDSVNLGSYYTPLDYVNKALDMLNPYIDSDTVIIDNACGYGNFIGNVKQNNVIGCDIDKTAVDIAKTKNPYADFYITNSLDNVHRSKFGISQTDTLAIVGNPPYNDKTSIIRQGIKNISFPIDADISSKDLGMSFLLSYNKLSADFVCVLHPLSYLIKRTNFNLLKQFTRNYQLIDGVIISSGVFSNSKHLTQFPILISLYRRNAKGMNFDYISNFRFKVSNSVSDNITFCLNDFDYISRYIDKYPSKNPSIDKNSLFFWTMRDINALKRNRTFIPDYNKNAIVMDKNKLKYYAYVDVFKRYMSNVPFYFGNCDVVIDHGLFQSYKPYFMADAVHQHPFLAEHVKGMKVIKNIIKAKDKINTYFYQLLGKHYVAC